MKLTPVVELCHAPLTPLLLPSRLLPACNSLCPPLGPLLALSCPQPSTALHRCFPGIPGSFSVVFFPLRFCRPHFPLAVCHRRLFLVRGLVAQSAGDSRFRVGFIHPASIKITPACAVMHLASPKCCWHQLMSAARSGSGANRRQHA